MLRRKNRYLFEIVLNTNKDTGNLRLDIGKYIREVFDTMNKKKLKSCSISKCEYIGMLLWEDLYDILRNKVEKNVKIMICENKLIYVKLEDRNRIFNEMHESPQGGHRGILKTYQRIK